MIDRNLYGPRALLRHLRLMMAEPMSASERLDKFVVIIASNVVAEVCSIYLLRADGILELFATKGLKSESVRKTTLKFGEGLVGTVAAQAQILNLSDARDHPAFVERPETGEEEFNSFLGVPILRSGRVLGVLVIQNKAFRSYLAEEVEALQTTALVLAELIVVEELQEIEKEGTQLDLSRSMEISGVPLSNGIGLGQVVLHEPRVVVNNLIAEDTDRELIRLNDAVNNLRISLDKMLNQGNVSHTGEHREVLETYRMFAYDQGWVNKMKEAIRNGLTAEGAAEQVQNDTRARMLRITDSYLRERLHDFDDLSNRLIKQLISETTEPDEIDHPSNAIIVARNMGATELLDYERSSIRGLVLEEGGPTSHVAIVAKALGIPAVGHAKDVTTYIESGDDIIIDSETGIVHLRPPADLAQSFVEKVKFTAKKNAQYLKLRDEPTKTKDGTEISLKLNAGLLLDLTHLDETGADGIGLFRTEIKFMLATKLPSMYDQEEFYSQVLENAGERPVIFRTLDIGGDKVLPYMNSVQEENPAMGWRAIRLSLDRPEIFSTQIRALFHAAADQKLNLMFPMIATVDEFRRGRELVNQELKECKREQHKVPEQVALGAMIEVPSLLFQLEELMSEVDFVSVGSNDLFQFFMAADRGNIKVTNRFDVLSISFLRALKFIAKMAYSRDIPITLCGEIAGNPLTCMALLGLGYRSVSMSPSAIGPVKAMLLKLDLEDFSTGFLEYLTNIDSGEDMRHYLESYASKHKIPT